MTAKALTLSASGKCLPRHTRSVTEERVMAPDAVFLDHFSPGLPDVNGVRFMAEGEDCCMPHAVAGLEHILSYKAVMGYMTGIAVSDASVCAV